VLLGFTTHAGTVTAAADWDSPAQRRTLRPARDDSHEGLFHTLELPAFVLPLAGTNEVRAALGGPRLERAVGVVYAPQTERISHYFHADLARQFDAVVHIDRTQALQPLDPSDRWQPDTEEETYPSGL
jgi:erythromycin esterase-like protein